MKTKIKHTPEPWQYCREYGKWVSWHEPKEGGDFEYPFECDKEANAERIVECVNAMEGIEDPFIIKVALKEMYELILFWQKSQNKEGWSSEEEDIIIEKYGSIIKSL